MAIAVNSPICVCQLIELGIDFTMRIIGLHSVKSGLRAQTASCRAKSALVEVHVVTTLVVPLALSCQHSAEMDRHVRP